jgi:hypothetical protein
LKLESNSGAVCRIGRMQDVRGSLSALIFENNVALFRDDAGVECAAVTRVNQVKRVARVAWKTGLRMNPMQALQA